MKILLLCLSIMTSVAFGADTNLKNETELGLTDVSGNAQATTFHAKHQSIYNMDLNVFSLKGQYFYGEANDELSVRNWNVILRYDRVLSDRFSLFASEGVEGNKFAGYVWRSNTDVGAKYFIMPKANKDSLDYFFTEFGYRLSDEERVSGVTTDANTISHQSRLYAEYSKACNQNFSFKTLAEWIKTYGNDNRNQVNAEFSANSKMSDMLTMKLAYNVRYDDTLKERGLQESTDKILTVAVIANY